MPHLFVEYTNNLPGVPEQELLAALNERIVASGQVQQEHDLKSRIVRTDRYAIGTRADASRAFVHAELRLLAGRTPEVKRDLSDRIAAVLREHLTRPAGMQVQLSVDIVDMDRDAYFKGEL